MFVLIVAFGIFGTVKLSDASGTCGNAACDVGESCSTCAADCGACTITWADQTASLFAGVSNVRGAHMAELRAEINVKRNACGLAIAGWTDDGVLAGKFPRAVHVTEHRAAIKEIYDLAPARPLSFVNFTDNPIVAGVAGVTRIRLVHLLELRTAIEEASCCGDGQCDTVYEDIVTCFADCQCGDNFDCDDGDPCTGVETCVATACVDGADPAPVNGDWSGFGSWGSCEASCNLTRSRTCTNPPSSCGGADCVGSAIDSQACTGGACSCGDGTCDSLNGENCFTCTADCGVPSGSVCPSVCGNGVCDPSIGETCLTCQGDCGSPGAYNVCPVFCGDGSCNGSETCSTCVPDCGCCPVNGGWNAGFSGPFGACQADCTKTKERTCTSPIPSCGGADCSGASSISQTCTGGACPCGNGFCIQASETCLTCPEDCGLPGAYNVCPPCDETYQSCLP